ncbi:MAG: GTPase Era [Candidatus Dasytiphilus stammeri]
MKSNMTYCGFISLIGRTNVGKSTLLNRLIGRKISITSNRKQTTRNRIIGIATEGCYQSIYIDTPGCDSNKKILNILMNSITRRTMRDVSVVIFMVVGTIWTSEDQRVLSLLQNKEIPVILVINKIDIIYNKSLLLPHIQFLNQQKNFIDIIPISAITGFNVDKLAKITRNFLPLSEHIYGPEFFTDQPINFTIAEIIREKLIRVLGDEIPSSLKVKIEKIYVNKDDYCVIYALIMVNRISHKKIIIGINGNKIKNIGIKARCEIEKIMKLKVYLKLWIKVQNECPEEEIILPTRKILLSLESN